MSNILENKEYEFLNKFNLCYICYGGSYAYGTNNENSDIDIRGVYTEDINDIVSVYDNSKEVYVDNKTDTVVYSLKKFLTLVVGMNPNIIEMLGVREKDVLYANAIGKYMHDNVGMFLSKKAFFTFNGYALSQLGRLKNALNHNGVSISEKKNKLYNEYIKQYGSVFFYEDKIDLDVRDMPIDLAFDMINDIRSSLRNKSVGHRNNKKTEDKLNKHAMHLLRLFYMGIDILEKGKVNTYRYNEREMLLAIRKGEMSMEEVFKKTAELEERMKNAYRNSTLPDVIDKKIINDFYRKAMFDKSNL